jgi:hypothetical protein
MLQDQLIQIPWTHWLKGPVMHLLPVSGQQINHWWFASHVFTKNVAIMLAGSKCYILYPKKENKECVIPSEYLVLMEVFANLIWF